MAEPASTSDFIFQDISRFRSRLFDHLIGPSGLSYSQAAVLAALFKKDEQIQAELAAEVKVGNVTLGGLVDRLEAAGLVERRAVEGDRRAKRVCLTEKAYPIGRIMKKQSIALNDISFAGMTSEEAETLDRLLDKVRQNLLNALNDPEVLNSGSKG